MNFVKFFLALTIAVVLIAPQSTFSQNRMDVGGELSLAMPMGDFGDGSNTGFGFTGVFTYHLDPQLALIGSIGYISFGSKVDGISFSTMPINAGVHYKFNPGQKFQPYIGAETLFFMSSSTVDLFGFKSSVSSTDFGFTPIVGAAFPISPKLEIRANLKYHILFTSGSSTTFLGIGGGLHYVL